MIKLATATFAAVLTIGAIAPISAEAGPNCGQYDTKQERQICRGLRDGIKREIREDLRDARYDRYGRYVPYGRLGRFENYNRYDRHDERMRRRVENGLAEGLADIIRDR